MKLLVAALFLAGCVVDEQNVGNTRLTPMFDSLRWAISIGGDANDRTSKVAIDPQGNVIAFGDFNVFDDYRPNDAIDFGGSMHAAPNGGSWISKRAAADGHEIWTRTFGSAASIITGLAGVVGSDGAVIVTGSFDGDLDLGTTVLHGPALHTGSDSFVAKYSPDGELVWSVRFEQPQAWIGSIAVADNGSIAIAGAYHGTITFPNGSFTAGDGLYTEAFVAMLDAGGHARWGASSGLAGKLLSVVSIAMTVEDDVIVAGDLYGTATFAGETLQGSTTHNALVARFTSAGQPLWARMLDTSELVSGPIAVAPDGALIAASTQGPYGSPRIERIDAVGNTIWTNVAPRGSASLDAMTVTHDGTIVTGGYTASGDIDVGSGRLDACTYLAAHDASGELRAVGTFGPRVPPCMQTNPASFASAPGTLALGGMYGAPVDLGGGALRFAGGTDALIAVYNTP